MKMFIRLTAQQAELRTRSSRK